MKRNRNNVTAGRRKKANKRSRYAEKVARGNQMYGPGCCAHSRTSRAEKFVSQPVTETSDARE